MARPSRTDEAAERLLDAIIADAYPAGSALPAEADLAAEFDVSRLTVREAVRRLQAHGVIVAVRGTRHRVAPVAEWTGMDAVVRHARGGEQRERSSLELLEVRMMIETGAAELAAARRDASHLRTLQDSLAAMAAAHERTDVDAFVEADLAFHDVILAAADNRILVASLRPLTTMLAETRRETSAVAAIREHAIREHTAVLEAVRSGDALAARDAMASHMRQTRDDLIALVHGA